MGQASARRKQFGTGAHDVATYIETEIVTAYKPDEDGSVRQAAIMVHAAARSVATAFHPSRDPKLAERLLATEPGFKTYPEDHILLVDPDSFAVLASLPEEEFDRTYSWIPGTVSYAKAGGREFRVAISGDGGLVLEGGVPIDDPIAFCRGKLRKAGRLPVMADMPCSFQLMCMFLFPGLDTDDAHLPHVLALSEAAVPMLHALPPEASADISSMHFVADVVEERGDDGNGKMPDLVSVTSAIGTLVHMIALDCPSDAFVREYCRLTASPLTVFRPRSSDDVELWEDLEGVLAAASAAEGEPIAMGEDAFRTSIDIKAVTENGHGQLLDTLSQLMSRGLPRLRYAADGGGTVDVMDFPGRVVMTLTMPGEAMEIVGWSEPA